MKVTNYTYNIVLGNYFYENIQGTDFLSKEVKYDFGRKLRHLLFLSSAYLIQVKFSRSQ